MDIEQLFYILAGLDGPAPPLQGPGQFCGSTSGSHAGFHTPMGQRAGFPAAAVRLFFCGKKENRHSLAGTPIFWWRRVDSNHRSETQQIYSLPPLATRELLHIQLELVDGFEPPTC